MAPKDGGDVIIREVAADFDRTKVQDVLDEIGQPSSGDYVKDIAVLMSFADGDLRSSVEYEIEVYEVPDKKADDARAVLNAHCIRES